MRSLILDLARRILLVAVGHAAATTSPAVLSKRLPSLDAYTLQNCYIDASAEANAVLPLFGGRSSRMTPEKCAEACSAYTYFGVRNGAFCTCGNELSTQPPAVPEDNISICDTPCPADGSQKCGGPSSISVWKKNDGGLPTPTPASPIYNSIGCYSTTGIILAGDFSIWNIVGLTLGRCEDICVGFAYWAVSGQECRCSSAPSNQIVLKDASFCDIPCPGDNSEVCGGSGSYNVYSNSPPCAKLGTSLRVQNPGFENGITSWQAQTFGTFGPGKIVWTSRAGDQWSGKRAARIDSSATTVQLILSQNFPVCQGVPYMVSYYAKQAQGVGCRVYLNSLERELALSTPLTTEYQKYEALSTTYYSVFAYLFIGMQCNGGPGNAGFRTMWLDQVEVRPATPAEVAANGG